MPAARYWRFYITAVDGGSYASAAEFELYESTDGTGTNRCLGGTASQTGDNAVGAASAGNNNNVNDEAGSSFSPGTPFIWTIDLGASYDLKSAAIVAQRSVPNRTAKDFKVQYSSNNTDWSDTYNGSGITGWTQFERRVFTPFINSKTVSGTVYDSEGQPSAGRTVRAYRRDTGSLLGSATTDSSGAYSILVGSFASEVQIVCLDDAGGTLENDLILRTFPV